MSMIKKSQLTDEQREARERIIAQALDTPEGRKALSAAWMGPEVCGLKYQWAYALEGEQPAPKGKS